MSSFALEGSVYSEAPVRLTDNTVTTLYTADGAMPISSIIVAPNSGTPTCTLYVTDASGTNRVLWTATAPFIFNEYYVLPTKWSLKAQSSDASGKLDIHVSHGVPASARQRPFGA